MGVAQRMHETGTGLGCHHLTFELGCALPTQVPLRIKGINSQHWKGQCSPLSFSTRVPMTCPSPHSSDFPKQIYIHGETEDRNSHNRAGWSLIPMLAHFTLPHSSTSAACRCVDNESHLAVKEALYNKAWTNPTRTPHSK